jgi:endonuclease YncB( thermonuclease family)
MRPAAAILLGLAIAAVATARPGEAACTLADQGSARVAAVIDGRTVRLTDGREIRLAGLAPTIAPSAAATLATLTADRDVTLRGQDDSPDRYGRQSFFVYPDVAGPSAQATLLARGEAIYSGMEVDTGCVTDLRTAEATARNNRMELWANQSVIKNAENPGDILAQVGQFAVVEGKVVSVRQAGTVFYVNFGRRWTESFAVTISGRMMPSLEAAGIAPKSFENRRIRVRGWVERRAGPQIELFRAGQIEVIADR